MPESNGIYCNCSRRLNEGMEKAKKQPNLLCRTSKSNGNCQHCVPFEARVEIEPKQENLVENLSKKYFPFLHYVYYPFRSRTVEIYSLHGKNGSVSGLGDTEKGKNEIPKN